MWNFLLISPLVSPIIFTHCLILRSHLSAIFKILFWCKHCHVCLFFIFNFFLFFICRLYYFPSPLTCRFLPPPGLVLVVQNQQNVCFPSKGWLSLHTGSISQGILRRPSATACSCGGRSPITLECCCSCPPFTSSAEDLTGETEGRGGKNVRCK